MILKLIYNPKCWRWFSSPCEWSEEKKMFSFMEYFIGTNCYRSVFLNSIVKVVNNDYLEKLHSSGKMGKSHWIFFKSFVIHPYILSQLKSQTKFTRIQTLDLHSIVSSKKTQGLKMSKSFKNVLLFITKSIENDCMLLII